MRLAVAISAAVALLVAAVVWAEDRPESTLERARRTGTVRVAFAQEPPYAYRGPDGRVTGESAEIARRILAELGVRRIEWVRTEFGTLIPALVAGHVDVIAAGMFITAERSRLIDFSVPTSSTRTALLVRAADAGRYATFARVRELEARLAVVDGTYEIGLANAAGMRASDLLVVPDVITGIAALRSGRVDGVALTRMAAQRVVSSRREDDFRVEVMRDSVVGGVPVVGMSAFGFRQQDDSFREAFDAGLVELLGTPEHRELVRPFGFTPAELDLPQSHRK